MWTRSEPAPAAHDERRGTQLIDGFLTSSANAPPLRVALLIDSTSLPRQHAIAVDLVLRSSFVSIVAVVLRDAAAERPATGPGGVLKAFDAIRRVRAAVHPPSPFELYERWDAARVASAASLLAPMEVGSMLEGIPQLRIQPIGGENALLLPPAAVAKLRALRLDVAIRLGFEGLAGDALQLARCGIWSYRYGDGDGFAGAPHFRELAEGNPLSAVSLELEGAPDGARRVLCRGFAPTVLQESGLSLARNRVKPQLLGASFAVAKLKELHEQGFDAMLRRAQEPEPRGRARGVPSALQVATFLGPRLAGKARLRLEPPRQTVWRLAVRVGAEPRFAPDGEFHLDGFRWIEAPPGRSRADPCLVEHRGQVYCFFEDIDLATRRGRISCATVDSSGGFRDVTPVLELPYHLSYPLVFEEAGEWFMVPESRKNGTVDLFRAAEFPVRWEKVRTLFEARGVDTTVLRHQGRYYFFVTVREPPGASEQLLLFHADDLGGTLRFHSSNPISVDARNCRSAGAIFMNEGRWIRPTQDSSVTYGYRIEFHEITSLTESECRERIVATASPPAGMEGVHTYARCGAIEIIDGKRLERTGR